MPSKESLELSRKYLIRRDGRFERDTYMPEARLELADLLDEAIREAQVSEHKLTCHKPLLQYDAKGKLIGNLRCGEGWQCERLAQLEKR